jgi:hypothetical protein
MCLRFVFLLIMRLAAWLRLARREETWKTAEILILRHQLTVLQRPQPRLWGARTCIRCRRRRTFSSAASHCTACQPGGPPSGPFTTTATAGAACAAPAVCAVMASSLPFGSSVIVIVSVTSSPDPRQHPSGSRHQPVSGQLSGTASGGASHRVPVSCCLSAAGVRFSGHPVPARELGLPYGRLTGHHTWCRTLTGLPRSAPARYDRDGCPLYPGDGGALPGRMPCPASACRSAAASPCTPLEHPTGGATHHGASTGVHAIHPSGLPLACGPRMGREPSGFPLSSAPRCYQQRTSGRGRAVSTRPELHDRQHRRPSNPRVPSQGATSCRNGKRVRFQSACNRGRCPDRSHVTVVTLADG